MGPGIVIIFWLFYAAILGSLWLACLVVFIIGRRKRSPLMKWLAGVPLCGITLLACLGIGILAFDVIRTRIPSMVYKDAFHEKPSLDVAAIQSDAWSFADSGHAYLRFRAAEKTFRRILPKGIPRVSYVQYKEQMPGVSGLTPPSWWTPPNETTSEIYLRFGKGERFAGEAILVTYDRDTGTVQYFFFGGS